MDPVTGLFTAAPRWSGARRDQLAQARRFFDTWAAALPAHRAWLGAELAWTGGPALRRDPAGNPLIDGLDDVVEWAARSSGGPDGPIPDGIATEGLPAAPEWGGSRYWQAVAAGLTAVVVEVVRAARPQLDLTLRDDPGHAFDLLPAWTRSSVAPPWRLAAGGLRNCVEGGIPRLESGIRAGLGGWEPD